MHSSALVKVLINYARIIVLVYGNFNLPAKINNGRDPFTFRSDRSDREKRSTSKGGPVFSETFPVGPNRSIEFWTKIS